MNRNEKEPQTEIIDAKASNTNIQEPSFDTGANDQESTYLTGSRLWLVYTSVLLTVLLVALDESIVVTALAKLSSEFQALDQLTWVVSAFILTQAGLLLFFGQVLTIVSSKATFLFCIIIFEAGSLICALAPSMVVLICGRAIQGTGGSGLFLTMFAIISQIAEPKIRPMLLGSFTAVFGLASIFGPLLGGVFSDRLSWRWCFYINLPFGAVSLVAVVFLQPRYPPPTTSSEKQSLKQKWISLDWIGTILAVAMTACFLRSLQSGGVERRWDDPAVIALFVTAAILLVFLLLWERRLGDRAMMPLSILLRRTQLSAGAAIFTIMVVNAIFTYYLPFRYQALGKSAEQSGINIIPYMIAMVTGSVVGGWLNSATGWYNPYLIGGSVITTIAAGLFFATNETTSDAKLIGYQILLGVGQGIAMNQPLVALQVEYADTPHLIPQASAIHTYLWLIGALCGISMAGAVFGNQLSKNLANYSDTIPPTVVQSVKQSVSAIFSLPPQQQTLVVTAYIAAVGYVFLIAVVASGITLFAALLLKNKNIKEKPANSSPAP